MKRVIGLFGVLAAASLSTGCVERRFVIESEPPTAQVFLDGQPIGFAPADASFVYYGKYRFTLVKDGYQTLDTVQAVRPPWYEIPPLDFVFENLVPFKIRDVRRLRFTMEPLKAASPEQVKERGQLLRDQGRTIGVPRTSPPPGTPSGPAPAPGQVQGTVPPQR